MPRLNNPSRGSVNRLKRGVFSILRMGAGRRENPANTPQTPVQPPSKRRLSPSLVISVLALVFAMSGGAYAASRVLITSTKQISPKVLKSLKGVNGKNGATGTNGTNGTNGAPGPQGPAGGAGPAGGPGPEGPKGANGPNGESVKSKTLAEKNGTGKCEEGGSEFTVEGKKTYACNGEKGAIHAGETLPPKRPRPVCGPSEL